jgi:hypothetical protein
MTTRADGRGGSTPSRPAAPAGGRQWFVFKPWVYDAVTGWLPRAASRIPQPLRVLDRTGHAPAAGSAAPAASRTRPA